MHILSLTFETSFPAVVHINTETCTGESCNQEKNLSCLAPMALSNGLEIKKGFPRHVFVFLISWSSKPTQPMSFYSAMFFLSTVMIV